MMLKAVEHYLSQCGELEDLVKRIKALQQNIQTAQEELSTAEREQEKGILAKADEKQLMALTRTVEDAKRTIADKTSLLEATQRAITTKKRGVVEAEEEARRAHLEYWRGIQETEIKQAIEKAKPHLYRAWYAGRAAEDIQALDVVAQNAFRNGLIEQEAEAYKPDEKTTALHFQKTSLVSYTERGEIAQFERNEQAELRAVG